MLKFLWSLDVGVWSLASLRRIELRFRLWHPLLQLADAGFIQGMRAEERGCGVALLLIELGEALPK